MENPVSTNNNEEGSRPDQSESEERTFVSNLYRFMKDRGTPIERIPHLGFKQSEFILLRATLHHLHQWFFIANEPIVVDTNYV